MKSTRTLSLAAACLCGVLTFAPEATADQVIQVNAGRGNVNVYYPDSYDPSEPLPLLIGLHGYSHYGQGFEDYLQLRPHVDSRKFIYLYPNGTIDPWGNRYWNATNNCCDFWNTNVNDSGYIQALVSLVKGSLSVDENRVATIGHSNGGYMSYRLACDAPETFAAIISIAGATWNALESQFQQPDLPQVRNGCGVWIPRGRQNHSAIFHKGQETLEPIFWLDGLHSRHQQNVERGIILSAE